MSVKKRTTYCAIAAKIVVVSLRHGGTPGEPAHVYVRCAERDCQYVDLNHPPCPLTPAMFDDGSDQHVTAYLRAHAGSRICYACIVATLGIDHDQVRRASWRLKATTAVGVQASRCAVCHRRGVTIGLPRGAQPVMRVDDAATPEHGPRRVIEFLEQAPGQAFCAACIALSAGLGLAETRRGLEQLRAMPELECHTATCSACGRVQATCRLSPPRTLPSRSAATRE